VELAGGRRIVVDLHTDNSVTAMLAIVRFEPRVHETPAEQDGRD
jgi:hypothetical protein